MMAAQAESDEHEDRDHYRNRAPIIVAGARQSHESSTAPPGAVAC